MKREFEAELFHGSKIDLVHKISFRLDKLGLIWIPVLISQAWQNKISLRNRKLVGTESHFFLG